MKSVSSRENVNPSMGRTELSGQVNREGSSGEECGAWTTLTGTVTTSNSNLSFFYAAESVHLHDTDCWTPGDDFEDDLPRPLRDSFAYM